MPSRKKERPRDKLYRLGGWVGGSIGQIEALAGVDVQSVEERRELWWKFSHLFGAETQLLFDAVMDHCSSVALNRIARGEMSLLPAR
jgi:hypothetical protein